MDLPELIPPPFVTSFDSAAGALRATAQALRGVHFRTPDRPHPVLERLAPLGNALPLGSRQAIYSWAGYIDALPPRRLDSVDAARISAWIARSYPRRQYPVLVIGSPVGSAVHLALALGAPLIPQTVLISVRRIARDPDDLERELEWGRGAAPALLERNPSLALHHMADPNQDRLMLRMMAYFRVKLLRLGSALRLFITDHLEPGGSLILVDCARKWPVIRIGDRHVFQCGGEGGLSPAEYYGKSPSVEAFLERCGSRRDRLEAPEPDDEAPEAEWGFEPRLEADVVDLAGSIGARVRRIRFPEVGDLSPFVADLHRWWYAERGVSVRGLLVESFTLIAPLRALETGLVPFWSVFPVEPQVRAIERYLDRVEPYERIYAFLFSHGIESVGSASIERWRTILSRGRATGSLLGVDPRRFPADFASLVRFHRDLTRAVPESHPPPRPLSVEELERFVHSVPRDPVELIDVSPRRVHDR